MKRIKKEYNLFFEYNIHWYPMFSDAELKVLLEKLRKCNPGHPFLADQILIGKN